MPTDIRKQLIAPCATRREAILDDIVVDLDLGALLRRILLFDRYIVESWRLAEFAPLIKQLGADGVLSLLRSGAVGIHCDVMEIGELREQGSPSTRYSVFPFHFPDRESLIHEAMVRIDKIAEISKRKRVKIKEAAAKILVGHLPDEGVRQVQVDIDRHLTTDKQGVLIAASLILSRKIGRNIAPSDFVIELHQVGLGRFDAESNISEVFGLDEESAHALIRNALLGVGRLDLRLAYMKNYSALSGLRDEERLVLEHRCDFMAAQFSPTDQERRLHRVLEIAGLPDLGSVGPGFRIERLLEIRESQECTQFRNWLSSVDDASDREIKDQVRALREKIASIVQSPIGKTIRFLTTTAVGFIPLIGMVAGPVTSGIDTFLIDRVLKESGPHAFLSHHYPSLFSVDKIEKSIGGNSAQTKK
jgi:hypothetical protein